MKTVKANSWQWKLATRYMKYLRGDYTVSICQLGWAMFINTIIGVIYLYAIASYTFWIPWSLYARYDIGVIHSLPTEYFILNATHAWVVVTGMMGGLIAFAIGTGALVFFLADYSARRTSFKNPIKNSLLYDWYRAKKDKVCTIYEVDYRD